MRSLASYGTLTAGRRHHRRRHQENRQYKDQTTIKTVDMALSKKQPTERIASDTHTYTSSESLREVTHASGIATMHKTMSAAAADDAQHRQAK